MNSAHELSILIDALRNLHRDPAPKAALATLTRTRGSTFRRPGTRMLVLGDGQVVCELSGGCPQRDIVARALEAMDAGEPRLIAYNAESSLDVLIEMGCGGELEVLLEPLLAMHDMDFIDTLASCLQQRRTIHMATLFALDGAPVKPRRMVWNGGESLYDAIDDATLAQAVRTRAQAPTAHRAATVQLPAAHGMADVLLEAIAPPHALVVIGSSAAARALLPLAGALGWRITLVDHDPDRLRAADLPAGLHTACASPGQLRQTVALDEHSSVVVMTHNLEQDIAYLHAVRDAPVAYIGALGSRERVARMRHHPVLDDVHMHAPAGLDIGSETPEEIALAIAAEIMTVINRRSGGHLRDNHGAIH